MNCDQRLVSKCVGEWSLQLVVVSIAMGAAGGNSVNLNNIAGVEAMVLGFRHTARFSIADAIFDLWDVFSMADGSNFVSIHGRGICVHSRGVCVHCRGICVHRSICVHCRGVCVHYRSICIHRTTAMGINLNNIARVISMVLGFRDAKRVDIVDAIFDLWDVLSMADGGNFVSIHGKGICVHSRGVGVHCRGVCVHYRSVCVHRAPAMGINLNNIAGVISMVLGFRDAKSVDKADILLNFGNIFAMANTILDDQIGGIAIGSNISVVVDIIEGLGA